jgi:hypothetical protein
MYTLLRPSVAELLAQAEASFRFKPWADREKKALAHAKGFFWVGPTGLLRHLRIAETQHPLLQCYVKPACSQVQMLCRHATFLKKWSGRQDCFAISALPRRNIRCCNATLNLLVRRFKCSVVMRHF